MIEKILFYCQLSMYCLLLAFPYSIKGMPFDEAASYQICFTPQDDCTAQITHALEIAKRSVYMQAYFLTSEPVVSALIVAKLRGLDVNVMVDKGHPENQKSIQRLLEVEIPIWIDHASGIAHNKVVIIDEKTVITGSFNFTQAANHRNRENVLMITDKKLAQRYLENWHLCAAKAVQAVPVGRQNQRSTPKNSAASEELAKLALLAALGISAAFKILTKKTRR